MKSKRDPLLNYGNDSANLLILFGFALAQPLFDLLAQNPEFFVVRHCEVEDVFLLALAFSFLLPGLVLLPWWLVSLYRPIFWILGRSLIMLVLVSLFFLPICRKIGVEYSLIPVAMAVLIGTGFTWLYSYRQKALRLFLLVLTPTIFLFPGLFLFNAPLSVLSSNKTPIVAPLVVTKPIPVVMILFDELPLTSLMNHDRVIDAANFPAFASLANDSTWYRNAITVSDDTLLALPSILTGKISRQPPESVDVSNVKEWQGLPVYKHHPRNLFTALHGSHTLKIQESASQLCAKSMCPKDENTQHFGEHFYGILADLSVVYLHIVLPKLWSSALPQVSLNWEGFARREVQRKSLDKNKLFMRFVASIQNDGLPLYFFHSLLPHSPWIYLPSGTQYAPREKLYVGRWPEDTQQMALIYQRHLLQLQNTDRLLGLALARLKKQGLYDRAMVIVGADHGASFLPGKAFRAVFQDNYQDILSVPLFIKYPQQRHGDIVEATVKTIDILPTILHTLEVENSWPMEGIPVQERTQFGPSVETVNSHFGSIFTVQYDPDRKYQTLTRKLHLFPYKDHTLRSEHIALIGLDSQPLVSGRSVSGVKVVLDHLESFAQVDPATRSLPALITGTLQWQDPPTSASAHIAIAINGVVRAVVSVPSSEKETKPFSAMLLPESLFRLGQQRVEVFLIDSCNKRTCLRPLVMKSTTPELKTQGLVR